MDMNAARISAPWSIGAAELVGVNLQGSIREDVTDHIEPTAALTPSGGLTPSRRGNGLTTIAHYPAIEPDCSADNVH
jgi:hypothetical protein